MDIASNVFNIQLSQQGMGNSLQFVYQFCYPFQTDQ